MTPERYRTRPASRRAIYPGAIAADLGVCIHNLVLERGWRTPLRSGWPTGSPHSSCARRTIGAAEDLTPRLIPGAGELRQLRAGEYPEGGTGALFFPCREPDYKALPGLLQAGKKFDLIFIDGLTSLIMSCSTFSTRTCSDPSGLRCLRRQCCSCCRIRDQLYRK